MMEAQRQASRSADERVTEEQKRYRPGDIIVSDPGYRFPVFHDILDIEKLVRNSFMEHGESYEDEGIYLLDLYREPHMKYYCFTKSYSEACPSGELGDFHRSAGITTVPREYLEALIQNGFTDYSVENE